MEFSRQEYWSGLPCSPLGDLPTPEIEPGSPTLQADRPSEPPGKPENTGVGSLPVLQGNLPTQELNWGLLHCRQVLYQLSYSGSPASTSNTMLNRNDGSGHSCLTLEFRGDTFSFSLLSMLTVSTRSFLISAKFGETLHKIIHSVILYSLACTSEEQSQHIFKVYSSLSFGMYEPIKASV